jgi:hypothetical protein
MPRLLVAVEHDRKAIVKAPGAVTLEGEGPPPAFVESLPGETVPGTGILLDAPPSCPALEFGREGAV